MVKSSHVEEQAMVSIHSLRKVFPTTDGAQKVAVDSLNLSMMANDITGLLGVLLLHISTWSISSEYFYFGSMEASRDSLKSFVSARNWYYNNIDNVVNAICNGQQHE